LEEPSLSEEGALVVVTGRDQKKAETVATEIGMETKRTVVSVTSDLSTDEGAKALADRVISELGGVDILVNNHGVYFERGWWNTTPAAWAEIYNQNVVSFVRMVQHLGPRMREGGLG